MGQIVLVPLASFCSALFKTNSFYTISRSTMSQNLIIHMLFHTTLFRTISFYMLLCSTMSQKLIIYMVLYTTNAQYLRISMVLSQYCEPQKFDRGQKQGVYIVF